MSENQLRWYALNVHLGREDDAKKNLEKKIRDRDLSDKFGRILVPSEQVAEIKNGRKKVVDKKLYPSYMMVEMAVSDDIINHIISTDCISGFVGRKPDPLSDIEVSKVLSIVDKDDEKPRLNIEFKKGQKIRVNHGPFDNFIGVVDEILPDKGMIRITTEVFGRATPVEMQYWEVELFDD